jgi:hypothetical protein
VETGEVGALSDFLAGDEPTAQQINDVLPRFVTKLADESITNNATPQSDDELFIAVASSTRYWVEMWMVFNSPAANDLKLQWTSPAGVAGWWRPAATNLAAASETIYQGSLAWGTQAQIEGSASDKSISVVGILVTAGTAGTLQLQWAQNTNTGNTTTVKANSVLKIQKIA